MSSYQDFASLYDALTFDVRYDSMADFIVAQLKQHAIKDGLVLDLACGTGTLTLALAARGYDMLGADASEDMLAEARKKPGSEKILFLNQSMENFELYGTVNAIVCALDSINYLTTPEALARTFALCANYLNPGGILIFDVNSEYKFQQLLGQQTYCYETDSVFYVWDNDYDPEKRLCKLYLTFFCEEEPELYRRIDEVHTQRFYTDNEIQTALKQVGLTLLARHDDYTTALPKETSQRIVYVAECTKSKSKLEDEN